MSRRGWVQHDDADPIVTTYDGFEIRVKSDGRFYTPDGRWYATSLLDLKKQIDRFASPRATWEGLRAIRVSYNGDVIEYRVVDAVVNRRAENDRVEFVTRTDNGRTNPLGGYGSTFYLYDESVTQQLADIAARHRALDQEHKSVIDRLTPLTRQMVLEAARTDEAAEVEAADQATDEGGRP